MFLTEPIEINVSTRSEALNGNTLLMMQSTTSTSAYTIIGRMPPGHAPRLWLPSAVTVESTPRLLRTALNQTIFWHYLGALDRIEGATQSRGQEIGIAVANGNRTLARRAALLGSRRAAYAALVRPEIDWWLPALRSCHLTAGMIEANKGFRD
ncbi:hypothetical protein J2R80_000618 [Bradyrhizobium sp. USDA 4541]|nr:hypothetical protein [Bradyrhizobium sp. USDA 4541]